MLEITIQPTKMAVETDGSVKIVRVPERKLRLEHSLSSMSKWEEKWEIPFLSKTRRTPQQLLSYVESMSLEPIDEYTLAAITKKQFEEINDYLSSKRSATWFSDEGSEKSNGTVVTSELIYYWMTAFGIPFECDKWPIQRLMNLIKIAQIKTEQQNPNKKKRPTSSMLSERAALNAKRRAELNSTG